MTAKRSSPLSLRIREERLVRLRREAGEHDMTVNAYVNFKLFEQGLPERKSTIKAIAAQILALLGASGIGPAIRSMAQAVEQGALPLDPETQASIRAACADIAVIKSLLMKALGIKER